MNAASLETFFWISLCAALPAGLGLYLLIKWLGVSSTRLPPVEFPISTVLGAVFAMLTGMLLSKEAWGVAVYILLFFGMLVLLLRFDGLKWSSVFGCEKVAFGKVLFLVVGSLVLIFPAVIFLLAVSQMFLITIGFSPDSQAAVQKMLESREFGEVLRLVLLAVVAAPLIEEFLFRGVLYRRLRVHMGGIRANLIQAALFSAVHVHAPGAFSLFVLGLVLARLYEKSGNIFVPVAVHMIFNLVNVAIILLTRQVHGS